MIRDIALIIFYMLPRASSTGQLTGILCLTYAICFALIDCKKGVSPNPPCPKTTRTVNSILFTS
jgi:hypothetical protein